MNHDGEIRVRGVSKGKDAHLNRATNRHLTDQYEKAGIYRADRSFDDYIFQNTSDGADLDARINTHGTPVEGIEEKRVGEPRAEYESPIPDVQRSAHAHAA